MLLETIERSSAADIRVELYDSLRRQIRGYFPGGELVLVSKLHLNYSIVDLAVSLEKLLNAVGLKLPARFPRPLFLATIPAVEVDQALLHGILAHEIGHALYNDRQLPACIFPVDIDQAALREVVEHVRAPARPSVDDGSTQEAAPLDQMTLRSVITSGVNSTITNWITELACDVYGVLTLGPAFIFASLRFSTAFQRLDATSATHPPDRLRLRLQFKTLDSLYSASDFSATTRAYLDDWRSLALLSVGSVRDLLEHLALASIKDDVLDRIVTCAKKSLAPSDICGPNRYKAAITSLVPLINAQIPPAEVVKGGTVSIADAAGILNAGWEVIMTGAKEFAAGLRDSQSQAAVATKLNNLLLKALELREVKTTWEELRSVPK